MPGGAADYRISLSATCGNFGQNTYMSD